MESNSTILCNAAAVYITALVQKVHRINEEGIPMECLNNGAVTFGKIELHMGKSCDNGLLLLINQKNLPVSPHKKQKELMKMKK